MGKGESADRLRCVSQRVAARIAETGGVGQRPNADAIKNDEDDPARGNLQL
jgi:hypothetical protein